MNLKRVAYYIKFYFLNLISIKGLSAILSSFGALWLIVEITDRFFKDTSIPTLIQEYRWIFFLAGPIIALYVCRPILNIKKTLSNRDISIEIAIGNIFSFRGSYIIGSNTTFDTRISRELISKKSVQGQFSKKFYGDELQLDTEINASLKEITPESLTSKRVGKDKRYPIGTVVKLNPKNQTAYFLAIAHINEYGVASGTFEDLRQCLGMLWLFIGDHGLKEHLIMPVLGTGFTRLTPKRHLIIHEIIKSFIAACSEKTLCDKLTIVISERDISEHSIDFHALGDYLHHTCLYTEFADNSGNKTGTPIN